MRDSGDKIELLMAFGGVMLFVWFCVAVLRWIWRALFTRPALVAEQSEIDAARKLLETPRPVVGGSEWMRYRCTPEMCEAPVMRTELQIHDTQAPGHDYRTCEVCQERPRYSGASYRSAN